MVFSRLEKLSLWKSFARFMFQDIDFLCTNWILSWMLFLQDESQWLENTAWRRVAGFTTTTWSRLQRGTIKTIWYHRVSQIYKLKNVYNSSHLHLSKTHQAQILLGRRQLWHTPYRSQPREILRNHYKNRGSHLFLTSARVQKILQRCCSTLHS